MSTLEVIKVASRSHKRRFLRLPEAIHENDPNFVQRIRASESELAGFFYHPFYNNADCQAFMVISQGVRQGRILAIENKAYRDRFPGENGGFIGFFESTNDPEVAQLLFECVEEWFVEKKIGKIMGPIHPSSNYETGLLVDGFDEPASFMTPYNPSYYEGLWTGFGFAKERELAAYVGDKNLFESSEKHWNAAQSSKEKFDVNIRPIDRHRFIDEIKSYFSLYNRMFVNAAGFVPLTEEEIEFDAKELKHFIVPELTAIMEYEGAIIGAGFVMLDYNPIIKKINGRLFPFGFLSLLLGRRKIHKARFMAPCIEPKYLGSGLGLSLVHFLMRQAADSGITEFELPLLETDKSAARTMEKLGCRCRRLYRLFAKVIA